MRHFMIGLLSERLPRKREFQTDLTQAFIVVHDRELDFLVPTRFA